MFYLYFAESLRNGKIYVGSTDKDPETRVKEHNSGSNKWSKENGPLKLVYYENYVCKPDVIAREKFFKTGVGRRIKKAIIQEMGS